MGPVHSVDLYRKFNLKLKKLLLMEIITNKEGKIQNSSDQPQQLKIVVSKMRRPVNFPLFMLIIISTAFVAGLAANRLPSLINLMLERTTTETLSLRTNPSFLPSTGGILRSHVALVEGEIKKMDGDKITLAAGDDEVTVRLSQRFVKSEEDSKEATDSSGRRVPPRPVLPDLKVGDRVQAGLGVVDGETVVTSIFVDTPSQ